MELDYCTALSITTIAAIGWTPRGERHQGAGGVGGPNALLACLLNPCPDDYFKEDWSVSNCHGTKMCRANAPLARPYLCGNDDF